MFDHIRQSIPSSIVVFLVALPLCLGIALGSGAPLISGIIAGVVGGIVVGSISGSHLSVSGPAAGLIAIVVAAIGDLGGFDTFLLAVVIAGIMQILFGILRMGIVGHYIPNTVIKGMMAAIGLILILKQIPHLVGYDVDFMGDEGFWQRANEHTFSAVQHALGTLTLGPTLVGLFCLGLLILAQRLKYHAFSISKFLPAPLMVVLLGTLASLGLASINPDWAILAEHRVQLPNWQEGLTFPNFNAIGNLDVWVVALTIAIIASLETLLCIEAADKLDPIKRVTPTNRELIAQGVGNSVSGLLGGLPITSVIVRTSANAQMGAKHKSSAILHGFILGGSVIGATALLNQIPLSVLAAILIMTGYKLISPTVIRSVVEKGYMQWVPFVITVVAILLSDLLKGIALGLVISLIFIAVTDFKSNISFDHKDDLYIFTLRRVVTYLSKGQLKFRLERIPEGATLHLNYTECEFLDADIEEVIQDFHKHSAYKNVTVKEIR
ncbi:MAG TPA: hypothetical protein DCE13_02435 [Cryomorphaceae bacterium]|nr:hypothetical protein [Cryomorphaceae bacterium]